MSAPPNGDGGPVAGTAVKSAAATLLDLPTMVRPANDKDDLRHVLASAYCVRGVRGRLSQLWVVRRCPFCSETHRHTAKPEAANGKRLASCHIGRYFVIAVRVAGQVAA